MTVAGAVGEEGRRTMGKWLVLGLGLALDLIAAVLFITHLGQVLGVVGMCVAMLGAIITSRGVLMVRATKA